ncbi:MAG: hypothetical protein I3273_00845 [Candidatus Moeniiplasma glomeromycotorum]|nr:hypothetical protein [Candidatus Moeniiplasma glomeromycotorum]MCE8167328.1 hypothetical protein [Candidatus Moeniiplasma glomeromycotorum]MCE8168658.1 hypothetical protein [Candidatus Moeniiplasma glomeromycotorum]
MNQIIEKLRAKFLPEVVFKYEICQENCHHCQEDLGCTIWKDKIGDIRDKIKKVRDLEKKQKKLEIDLGLVSEEAKVKIEEKLKEIKQKIWEEIEKIANSRVKKITIRLRTDPDKETIAHEFTHAFLVWHHHSWGHHGEKYEIRTQENTFLFDSLCEYFRQETKKLS